MLPGAIRQHGRLPGAAPSWGQDLGLQDGVSIPTPTASRMLALPGAIGQHPQHPGAAPSWGQDLGLQDGVSTPQPRPAGCWRSQGRLGSTDDSRERRDLGGITLAWKTASPPPNHRQPDAGAPRGDQAAPTTPGSAAILAAGPWLGRRRLHPTPTASKLLVLPGAIRQHPQLPGAPRSWRHNVGLQDGVSTPQPPPAQCWRSQGRSGSMHDSRERRDLGGITLACKTASPPPNHRQHNAGAPRGDRAAWTTTGSAAILGAGPWLGRRRLHPPTTASRMLALPIDCQSRESSQTTGPALFDVLGKKGPLRHDECTS